MDRANNLLSHAGVRRAVIVGGVRTPFVRSFGSLAEVDAIGLGVITVKGLLDKFPFDPTVIDDLIWGNVVVNSSAPNVAREIILDLNLPRKIPGVTVSRACLSGLQAIEQAVSMIESDHADVIIAGGCDSISNAEMPLPRKLTRALGKYAVAGGKKQGLSGIHTFLRESGPLMDWIPKQNEIAERSTGKTMGFHADLMAEINHIPRTDQDSFAAESHRKASIAQNCGYLGEEIVPVVNPMGLTVEKDEIIRDEIDFNKLSRLRSAFRTEEEYGTVTAASSSALTDGSSAVLVMSYDSAKRLGLPSDISIISFVTCAVDPFPQLLIAPALAIPKALQQANLSINDMDIFEIHEAFAAQVLTTIRSLLSEHSTKEYNGFLSPIPEDKINRCGGSIAIGHPFAATGGRLVISASNQLRRTGNRYALISICAAGGIGGVAILERHAQ